MTRAKKIVNELRGAEPILDIPIKKGDVRRAIRAADAVHEAAMDAGQLQHGMVLMTAVLLVERLANAHACDPGTVLNTLASCFDLKAQHMQLLKDSN